MPLPMDNCITRTPSTVELKLESGRDSLDHRVRKLIRGRRAADVAGADFAFCEDCHQSGFDFVRRGAFFDVS